MMKKPSVLAIIPARGGSKGLPRKNVLPLLNHPLISYSIEAALQCPLIDRTIVSTDSEEIARVALQYKAEVPFMRPVEFAKDQSTDIEVFVHALEWLGEHEGYHPEIIVQLRPTSPVRFLIDVEKCINALIASPDADSLRVVTPAPITPYKMWVVSNDSQPMQPLLHLEHVKEPFNEPRQRLPQVYWQTGTLDVIRSKTILEKKSMTGGKILPYIIENTFAVDIDDLESFGKAAKIIGTFNCIKFDNEAN
jgi:N-acylneuraminate cytidylyltransferase